MNFLMILNHTLVSSETVLGKCLFSEYGFIEISEFCTQPEMCEMGGNFWLQNEQNLFCRVWPIGQRPKRSMIWSQLHALYDFQNL